MKLELDQELTLTIERLGINGEGVGNLCRNNLKNRDFDKEVPQNSCPERATIAEGQGASEGKSFEVKPTPSKTDSSGCFGIDNFTIFVDGALPGETVRARLIEKRKTFGRAALIECLKTSPHRAPPPCSFFERCGGCQLMHLDYAQQLEAKRERVKDALERIGKLFNIPVLPCVASPSSLAYRNKIQLPVKDGFRLGLYARHTHDLIEIDQCLIHCDLGEKAFQEIQRILKATPHPEIKHLLIKTALHTKQLLVIIVTSDETVPKALADQILAAMPEIKGVVQNIQPQNNNTVLGKQFRTLAGRGWIEEKLHELFFKVSPASFFQVNPAQAEQLYQKVLEFAHLQGNEIILDAYCGVGTLSLILAKHAKKVVGLECVPEAISDAQENAERNKISNVDFQCGQAEKLISKMEEIDLAILNPPRKGCEPSFLQKLVALRPRGIIYVSCDPATLARDLQFLCNQGYSIDVVQPFDMFPQTAHVETVVSLKFIREAP